MSQRLTPRHRTVFLILLLALLYYVAARLSLLMAFENTNATPIWPPSGIALAFVWIFGYRVWPGIFIGAFLANVATFQANQFATPLSIVMLSFVIGIGNTLEALLGRLLMKRYLVHPSAFYKVENILKFLFLAMAACLSSSSIGVAFLGVSGKVPWEFLQIAWLTWWLGDVAGILTVTPLFLVFYQSYQIKWNTKQVSEFLLLLILLIMINTGIFYGTYSIKSLSFLCAYLLLPLVVWSAYRFGPIGTSLAVLMILGIAISGTIHGLGPFGDENLNQSLLFLLVFVGIISTTGTILAAAINESRRAEEELRRNEQKFRSLVENSSDMIALLSAEAKILYASTSTTKILGYQLYEYVGHHILDFIHLEDVNDIRLKLSQLLEGPEKIVYGTCRFLDKKGVWRWLEGTGKNLLHDPVIKAIVVNYRDITERKIAEERHRYILEAALDAFISIDEQGKIIEWNHQAELTFGWPRQDVLGKFLSEIIIPASQREAHRKGIERYLQINDSRILNRRIEIMALHRHGYEFPTELTITPISLGDRIVFSAFLRDITEQKKEEERLKLVVEASPNAIIMVTAEGNISLVNAQTEKLFGYQRQELIGQHMELLLPERFRSKHPQYRDHFFADPKARPMGVGRDLFGLHKKGHEVPIEIGLNPIHTTDGLMVLASIIDIGERKKSELALQESELRFRTMADTTPAMLWMSGKDTLCNFFNKAWLEFTGQTMEHEIGNGWVEGVHPEDRERCLNNYLTAFRNFELFTMDYRLKRWDGQYRWILDSGVPRFTSDGQFEGYIGSCIDITERKLAEDVLKRDTGGLKKLVNERSKELLKTQKELKQVSRLADIGTLAATVAHELRNPLGVIQMAAFNLRRKRADLSDDKHLNNIEKKIWEGNQIINNLLSYSRIKAPHYEQVKILKVLDECVATISARFKDTHIALEKKYDIAPDVLIVADPLQLAEIFNNILTNAYQAFANDSGTIKVGAKVESKKFIKLIFQDNGIGIGKEDLDKVFTPFFTRKSKGTGLGLAICNELVNLHDGSIDIASEKGKGTAVSIILPIKKRKNHG